MLFDQLQQKKRRKKTKEPRGTESRKYYQRGEYQEGRGYKKKGNEGFNKLCMDERGLGGERGGGG